MPPQASSTKRSITTDDSGSPPKARKAGTPPSEMVGLLLPALTEGCEVWAGHGLFVPLSDFKQPLKVYQEDPSMLDWGEAEEFEKREPAVYAKIATAMQNDALLPMPSFVAALAVDTYAGSVIICPARWGGEVSVPLSLRHRIPASCPL